MHTAFCSRQTPNIVTADPDMMITSSTHGNAPIKDFRITISAPVLQLIANEAHSCVLALVTLRFESGRIWTFVSSNRILSNLKYVICHLELLLSAFLIG